ncbi:hypothetical protein [Streptomyces cavernicola]|uniref:Uncharacterized protein n=1 Tax=Streptomyces cavernicola TaxID=3043613 RepID=A0ABT6S3K0_9ACTN|nr:hypothetical protein [Streptomyces sp. B-S-A6]MDI3402600.1 hypothetical protein [Streptomyces sp. B-S-A6]
MLKKILPYWGLIALVVAITGWLTSDIGPGGTAALFGLSFLWFLFQAPNPCGAPVRNAGRACRNNAKGVLRGCHLQQHKWQRMRTFFVRPRLRSCMGQLFENPVTGLASLGGILALISTVINTIISLTGKGGA